MPINYAGLALIMLGIVLMISEAFMPSFGALGLGGIVAFVIGSVMLIDTDVPGYGIPWALIVPLAVTSALFSFFVVGMAIKARARPVVTGAEEMIGASGEILGGHGARRLGARPRRAVAGAQQCAAEARQPGAGARPARPGPRRGTATEKVHKGE